MTAITSEITSLRGYKIDFFKIFNPAYVLTNRAY